MENSQPEGPKFTRLPETPTGYFIVVYKPQHPRLLMFVEPVVYEVTGTKGEKQLLLKTAHVPDGAEDKPRSYTHVGPNIAAYLPTLNAATAFLRICDALRAEYASTEAGALVSIETLLAPPPPRVRSRPGAHVAHPSHI